MNGSRKRKYGLVSIGISDQDTILTPSGPDRLFIANFTVATGRRIVDAHAAFYQLHPSKLHDFLSATSQLDFQISQDKDNRQISFLQEGEALLNIQVLSEQENLNEFAAMLILTMRKGELVTYRAPPEYVFQQATGGQLPHTVGIH